MDYRYFCSKEHIKQIRKFLHTHFGDTYDWEKLASMSDAECFDVLKNTLGLIPLIEFKNQMYHNDIKRIYLMDPDGDIAVILDSSK